MTGVNEAVGIFKLMHNVDVFMWLCQACLGKRLAKGWSQLEKRVLPFPQPCQDCVWTKEHPNG